MASQQNSSLIQKYSQTFTSLQTGKRELIQWGADPVKLNRYIVDAADSTSICDSQPVLQSIDLTKVTHGSTELECANHCALALKNLVALQEQATVQQKSARESGISAGLLTIIGQAASQSPSDNGASVLRQLSELVEGPSSNEKPSSPSAEDGVTEEIETVVASEVPVVEVGLNQSAAANDIDRLDSERMTGLQKVALAMREQWQSLLIDASACMVAAFIAISLIN